MSLEPKKALEAAFAARQSGNLAEAEAILLQLLSVRPQLTEAQMALGIVLMESGRPTEAVPVLQQIMSREPGCFPAANWLAVILTDLGKPEEALPHALQALKLRPKDLGAQVSMGRTLFSLGRYGDSVACFDRAIGIAPNDASYYYYKGCALEKMYRDDEAVVAFRAAVKISPTPSLLAQLADTEMTLGHSDEAMSAAERALKSEPNLGSALMSAEFAVELLEDPPGPVRLSAAPLVEGAVAAAVAASGGASLDAVADEARGALAMKAAQVGGDDLAQAPQHGEAGASVPDDEPPAE